MKYGILILSLFYAFLSSSQTKEITDKDLCDGILYILPVKAHNNLSKKLKERDKNIYIELSQESNTLYRIYIHENLNDNIFIEKTNKYIIISDRVYPLVLTTDYIFGVKQSPREILEQVRQKGEYTTTSLMVINDSNDYIEFDIRE